MVDILLGAFLAGIVILGGAYGLVIVSKIRAGYYKTDGCDCGCDC